MNKCKLWKFNIHRWKYPHIHFRICKRCGMTQTRVKHPFHEFETVLFPKWKKQLDSYVVSEKQYILDKEHAKELAKDYLKKYNTKTR